MKIQLFTTLSELRYHLPCDSGWRTLLASLHYDYPHDAPINLLHILESNGVQDTMWALRATRAPAQLRVAICADMAESVLPIWERYYPTDTRPHECIDACRQFVLGTLPLDQLRRTGYRTYAAYAASAAASAASAAASAVHAAAAAAAAAYAAASAAYAASAAASAAYAGAERKAQAVILRKYLQ
ncbi:MAG: putative immunity protein [Acidiferrobacteraceae bacterium]